MSNAQGPSVAQVKRLLEFKLREAEEADARLHGELATARGNVGRIERELRENGKAMAEIKEALANAPRTP